MSGSYELPPSRFHRFRTLGSTLTTLLGFALLAYGLFAPGLGTKSVLVAMGVGALLIFVGVSMLSVRLIGPLAWSLARRLRRGQEERERLLLRAIEASELERRRIASDLHDGVVQDLAELGLDVRQRAGDTVDHPWPPVGW